MLCTGVGTSHGNANKSRLGAGGEIGEVFEKIGPGSGCGTYFKKHRTNLNRSQTQIGLVAEEHAAAQQEDTQLQDLILS